MTKKRESNNQPDKGNVLSMLKAIEHIYNLFPDVLNTYAQTSLMLSLVIESQMLLLKFRVMRERWQYHLPFKEACKVKFGDWSHKLERMASSFADTEQAEAEPITEYCPSKHFLLDLFSLLPENTESEDYIPYYQETVMSRFISNQDRIRKQITEHWTSHYKQRFFDYVAEETEKSRSIDLQMLRDDYEAIRKSCHDILMELSEELSLLNELQEPDIQPDQFVRLADRVFAEGDYDGRKARKAARQDVIAWRNKTPKQRLEQSRKDEIDASIKVIGEMKYGSQLAEYIGEELDIRGNSEGVGQFLHHVRRDISIEELNYLLEQLYRIRFFREDKEQQEKASAQKAADANTVTQQVAETVSSTSPQCPRLPHFFKKKLSENSKAVKAFYETLHHTGRYMNGRLTKEEANKIEYKLYKKWKWNHLRVAFEKAGLTDEDIPKQHFAEFIHQVFPYITTTSVERSIQRYKETHKDFDFIVKDIVSEFKDVTDLIC